MAKKLMRAAGVLILVLVALWVGLSPRMSPGLYRSRLFHPDKGNGSQTELRTFDEVENHEVFFPTTDGGTLHGWIYRKPGARKVFLVHPGNAGDMAGRLYLTKMLLKSGASVFQYEPRGFGGSPGVPSPQTICEDGLAAFDYLVTAQGYEPGDIILYGLSLGASVATHVSTVRSPGAIILQSGFASLERIAKEQVPFMRIYPAWMFPSPRLDNATILERPHPPLLILHGEKDVIIPISHSEELHRRAADPKAFVRFPDSGHWDFNHSDLAKFVDTVTNFVGGLP